MNLQVSLELPDFRFILKKLLLVGELSVCQAFESRLLGFVQIVVEDYNWLVLSDREAHVAYTVLFGVFKRELFFVL